MAVARAATASTPKQAAAPAVWYSAAVVGLAVFLGVVLLRHSPIAGYRVEATLARATPQQTPVDDAARPLSIDLAAAEGWLKSEPTLRQIAERANPASAEAGVKSLPAPSLLNELRDHLQLRLTGVGGQQQWTVEFVGSSRVQAKQVVAQAAEALAGFLDQASDPRPRDAEIAALQREVRLADEERNRLEGELEQLRHEQLAAVLLHERMEAAKASAAATASDADSPAMRRRAGIVEKINDLRIEYRTLVATRLTSHPSVAAVAGQIEQLEAQLRELPDPADVAPLEGPTESGLQFPDSSARRLGGTTKATFTSLGSNGSLNPAFTHASQIEDARLRLHEATVRRQNAQTRLEAAAQLASTVWQKQWSIVGCGPAERLGGTPHHDDLMWAGVWGVIAATTISIDWSWFRRWKILATAAHARNALPAPLLGEIALPGGQPSPAPSIASPIRGRIIRLAEWMLIVALFLIILAAVSQHELAAQMASDPFGALIEAFDTVCGVGR